MKVSLTGTTAPLPCRTAALPCGDRSATMKSCSDTMHTHSSIMPGCSTTKQKRSAIYHRRNSATLRCRIPGRDCRRRWLPGGWMGCLKWPAGGAGRNGSDIPGLLLLLASMHCTLERKRCLVNDVSAPLACSPSNSAARLQASGQQMFGQQSRRSVGTHGGAMLFRHDGPHLPNTYMISMES